MIKIVQSLLFLPALSIVFFSLDLRAVECDPGFKPNPTVNQGTLCTSTVLPVPDPVDGCPGGYVPMPYDETSDRCVPTRGYGSYFVDQYGNRADWVDENGHAVDVDGNPVNWGQPNDGNQREGSGTSGCFSADDPSCQNDDTTQNTQPPQDQASGTDQTINGLTTELNGLNTQLDQCQQAEAKARQCCTSPQSCLGEALGMGGEESNIALQMLQTVMGGVAMTAQAAGSIGAMCGKMKALSYGAAIMNTALGATCQRHVSQCKSSCSGIQEQVASVEAQLNNLQALTADQKNSKNQQMIQARSLRNQSSNAITQCATYDNQTMRSAQAAIASIMAAKMAGACQKETQETVATESIAENPFNVDCSSAGAAANPVCQQQCSRPGAENDPACKLLLSQINLNGTNNPAPAFGAADPDASGASSFDLGDLDEDAQLPNLAAVDPKGTGLATANGGTGGLSGGIGAPMGGDDGSGAGGPVGAASLDNKLIRGYSSGTGYSQGLRTGGGGFGGYGGGGRAPASTGGKKFKLTDFLPGGKRAPMRHPSGYGATGHASPDIGPASANIFQMISNRYYLLCREGRLVDCEALKKRGCPINVSGSEACP